LPNYSHIASTRLPLDTAGMADVVHAFDTSDRLNNVCHIICALLLTGTTTSRKPPSKYRLGSYYINELF